jgi:hypothetical protein
MSEPLDIFQKIYVINLAARTDRRREMQEQFDRIGMRLDDPKVELFEAIRPGDADGFPSVGSRGCFLSHLGVLKRASASRLESILILEDDLNFADDFAAKMAPVSERLRRLDWSVFYGGYRVDREPDPPTSGCSELPGAEGVGTTHFIGLHGAAIASAAAYLEAQLGRPPGHPDGGPMHVDGAYCWFRRTHPEFRTLLAVPQLGFQRPSRTDVHDLRWYDRSVGVRSILSVIRRLKSG